MDLFDSCTDPTRPTNPNPNPDPFEETITLEKTHIEQGYIEGYNHGLLLGRKDGYQVGLKQGFISGEEIGFYRGLLDVWGSAIRVRPDCFSGRAKKGMKQMRDLIERYPFMDPENECVDDVVEGLRLKFRAVCASLGVKLEYNGYPCKGSTNDSIDF